MANPSDHELNDADAARRRDEVVKRMIATPPKKHEPLKGRGLKPEKKG